MRRPALRRSQTDAPDSEPLDFDGIQFEGGEIFDPVPDPSYLLRELDLCAGAPAVWAGAAFSAKTLAAQDLALAIVSGSIAWGRFAVAPGLVAHLDYEQGARLTRERYQRLARARGLGPGDVEDLTVGCYPPGRLDGPRAESAMMKVADGRALILIDSFRAACPGTDENSSTARVPLDMLARVSERTGCAFLVIHHARKESRDHVGSASMAIRGSSAIVDASGSVVVSRRRGDGVIDIAHCKARTSGVLAEPFAMRIRDVERNGDPRWGLVVEAIEGAAAGDERDREDEARILAAIEAQPGLTTRQLREEIEGMGTTRLREVMEQLLSHGRIEQRPGKRGAKHHFLTTVTGD